MKSLKVTILTEIEIAIQDSRSFECDDLEEAVHSVLGVPSLLRLAKKVLSENHDANRMTLVEERHLFIERSLAVRSTQVPVDSQSDNDAVSCKLRNTRRFCRRIHSELQVY